MAFDKDFIISIIETITKKQSTYTTSYEGKKKFSDVAEYVRAGKLLGKSLRGNATVDTDMGSIFNYKYLFNGIDGSAGYYEVNIQHMGDVILSMKVKCHAEGAAYVTKKQIAKMEAELKNFEGKAEPVKQTPMVDWSAKELPEILDAFDKKISEFNSNACVATFKEMLPVKEALDAKINALPLAERGKFSSPVSNLNMYINTLKTQLANPMIDVKQFVGTYVPQMQSALAEIAALIA